MYEKGNVKFGKLKYPSQGKGFYLPHSCDEWKIGGVKEARQLIKDLEELLNKEK